jgi:hypothetical protein
VELSLHHNVTQVFLLALQPLTIDVDNSHALAGDDQLWIKVLGQSYGMDDPPACIIQLGAKLFSDAINNCETTSTCTTTLIYKNSHIYVEDSHMRHLHP